MAYENLKRLLGEDVQQLNSEEMKERIGERMRDFSRQRIPTPINNEIYSDAVKNDAINYFNQRVDAVEAARIKDRYKNLGKQDLVNILSKKYDIESPKLIEEDMTNAYGRYNPENNTLNLNKNKSRNEQLSTIVHEMKHAADSVSTPIQDDINSLNPKFPRLGPGDASKRTILEGFDNEDPGKLEQDLLDNNFKNISEKYNRGHFFGNDQIENIAEETYNPTGWNKVKDKLGLK